MNPPLERRLMSRWSTEAATWIYFLFAIRKGGGAEFQSRLSNRTGSCSHVPPMKQLFQNILCKHQTDVAFVWVMFPIKQEIKSCFLNSCSRSSFLWSNQTNAKTKETQPKALRIWKPLLSVYSSLKFDSFNICASFFHTQQNQDKRYRKTLKMSFFFLFQNKTYKGFSEPCNNNYKNI